MNTKTNRKRVMKKKILFLTIILFSLTLHAQVGVNTDNPHQSTVLDVTSTDKGVLLPRMTTTQKTAITTPATGLMVYDTDKQCLSQNVGTEASPIWICLMQNQTRFFYMPSIAIDASATATNLTLDLYAEYKAQFNTPMAKSTSAPASIPYFPNATDLDYYITYYDNTVLKINSVGNDGKVSYNVIALPGYKSFMNVVFVVK